jgi:hypothetical protein
MRFVCAVPFEKDVIEHGMFTFTRKEREQSEGGSELLSLSCHVIPSKLSKSTFRRKEFTELD